MWAQFCEKYAPSAEKNKVSIEVANIKYVIDYFNHTYNNVHAAINELTELERLAEIGIAYLKWMDKHSGSSIDFEFEMLMIPHKEKLLGWAKGVE